MLTQKYNKSNIKNVRTQTLEMDFLKKRLYIVGKRYNSVLPSRPSVFVGRQDRVNEVVKYFKGGHHFLTLVGFPGVGKTTLAIAVAHDIVVGNIDWLAVYIPLRSITSVTDIPSLILRELAIGGLDQTDAKKRLLAWIKQLEPEEELLLVMDNLDDILETDQDGFVKLIQEMHKISGKVYFLFTSRKMFGASNMDVESVTVSPLDTKSASDMICELSSHVSKDESNQLASLCGCLPLALKLLGSLLCEGICQAAELISDLEESRSGKLDALRDDTIANERQVESVIKTSFDKLNNDYTNALITLGVFPGHFKREMAINILVEVVKFDEQGTSVERTARKIIHGLCNRSLLELDPQSQQLQTHPLVQSFLERTSAGKPLWRDAEFSFTKCYIEKTERLCGKYWVKNGAKDAMEEFDKERMNLEYVLKRPIPKTFQPAVLNVMNESFLFFRISMNHENYFSFIKNCKSIGEQLYGYASLESLFLQLLETTLLGLKGDVRVAVAVKKSQEELNKYAGDIDNINNDKEALLCVFVGLFYLIKRDFKKSPQYAITSIEWLIKNAPGSRLLGFAHRMLGVTGQDDVERSLDHLYKALDIQETSLGENPETLMIYHNIGSALLRQGEYHKSVHCFLSSYRMLINLRLNEHEDTAIVLSEMGEAYRCQGKLSEATRCLQDAMKVIATIGVYRASIWTYKFFARVLRDQNNFQEAVEYLDKALEASNEAFVQQHNPHITDISIDKAKMYADHLGKLMEALQLHQDCLLYDQQFNIPPTGQGRYRLLSREIKDYDGAFDEVVSKIDSSIYETSLCVKAHRKAAEIYDQKGNTTASQLHLDTANSLEN